MFEERLPLSRKYKLGNQIANQTDEYVTWPQDTSQIMEVNEHNTADKNDNCNTGNYRSIPLIICTGKIMDRVPCKCTLFLPK